MQSPDAQDGEAHSQEDVKRMRVLADRAAGVTKDKVAARDALALGRQLAQLDATPEQVLQFNHVLKYHSYCLCHLDALTITETSSVSDVTVHAPPNEKQGRLTRLRV